jgi:PAS domain S-box-containing protein
MNKLTKYLILEDNLYDAKLMQLELNKFVKKFDSKIVNTKEQFRESIKTFKPNIILSDYTLGQFNGLEALEIAKLECPDIPFIIVTGSLSEETAVACMKKGAWDYVLKDKLFKLESTIANVLKLKKEIENKKIIEEKLINSEKKFKALYNYAPLPYHSLNEDGSFRDVNPAWFRTLGYEKDEIIGTFYKDYLHPDWQPHFEENFTKFKNRGYANDVQFKIRHKEGHYIDISFEGCVEYNPDGSFKQTYCVFQDITQSKKAEKALLESEENLRRAQSVAQVGSWRFNLNTGKATISAESYHIYGIEEKKEFTIEELQKIPLPEYRQMLDETMERLVQGKDKYDVEFKIKRTNDGKILDIYSVAEYDPEENTIIGVIQDITNRKQVEKDLAESENKYRGLFENSTEFLFTLDLKGNFTDVNKAAVTLTGYTKTELLKKNFKDYISKADHSKLLLAFNKLYKTGEPIHDLFIEANMKDNSIRFFIASLSLLKKGDEIIGCQGTSTDITKRKKVEDTLAESEEKFRNITEQINEMIFLTDNKGKIKYISPASSQIFGYTPQEMENQLFMKYLKKTEIPKAMKKFMKTFINGSPTIDLELNMKHKTGNYFIGELTARDFRSEKLKGTIGVIRDISKQKFAEDRLNQSEIRFRELVNTINSGVAVYKVINNGMTGADYIVQEFNKAALMMEGLPKDKVVGRSLLDIRPNIDEYGLIPIFRQVWKTGKQSFFPAKKYVDDNIESYFENRVYKLPSGEIVAVFDDVTERIKQDNALQESVKRFKDLVEMLPEAVIETDLKLNLTYTNQRALEMSGYSEEEFKNGFSGFQILTPESKEQAKINLKKRLEGNDPGISEYSARKKDGTVYPILFHANSIIQEGNLIGLRALIIDITKRKQAEEQIKRNLKEKETLLQELYHRTKNNMQVISSMLHMESRRVDNELLKKSFREITSKINTMALVHQKLYQAKDLSRINLKEYIQDLVHLVIRGFYKEAAKITFQYEMEDIFALIDTVMPLGLVLNELLTNSFKHAFPSNTKGEIIIEMNLDHQDSINIILSDNGVGIPADMDLRQCKSMGLQTMFSLIEHQLQGSVEYETGNGLTWHIILKDSINTERV